MTTLEIIKEFRNTFKHSQFVNYSSIESFLRKNLEYRDDEIRQLLKTNARLLENNGILAEKLRESKK